MKYGVLTVSLLAGARLFAAEPLVIRASGPAVTNAPLPADAAGYASLKKVEFELTTTLKVLSELRDQHTKDAEQAGKTPRADWEKEWANRLDERMSVVSSELAGTMRKTSTYEEANKGIDTLHAGLGAFANTNSPTADEIAYLTLLQERMAAVRKEIEEAAAANEDFTRQLQTNNTPEEVGRISTLSLETSKTVKELQREQADLELRKLFYRALRK